MRNDRFKHPDPVDVDQTDLVEIVHILLKRRWLIICVTLLLVIAGVIVSYLMPNVYAVTAIIEPGKGLDDKVLVAPETIRENILGGAYDKTILDSLNLSEGEFPVLKVDIPGQTGLLKVRLDATDTTLAVKILDELLLQVEKSVTVYSVFEKDFISNQIALKEDEVNKYSEQIVELNKSIKVFENKIQDLESVRTSKAVSSDPIQILLYSSEIQNQQVFIASLYRELDKVEYSKKRSESDLINLKLKLSLIEKFKIIKKPTVNESPVSPRRGLIVVLSLIVGCVGSIFLALFFEFMTKVRHYGLNSQKSE